MGISSLGSNSNPINSSEQMKAAHAGKYRTTITTHCDKQRRHTPACPYTSVTQKIDDGSGKGRYIDTYA